MKPDNEKDFVLELSSEAYDDLVNIQNYTFAKFGEAQWLKYSTILDKALSFFLSHPSGEHYRQDIS